MVYEKCLAERNATLQHIYGNVHSIPSVIPTAGTLLDVNNINGTLYSIRMIPLGGFVQMEGESEESSDSRAFSNVSIIKRIAIGQTRGFRKKYCRGQNTGERRGEQTGENGGEKPKTQKQRKTQKAKDETRGGH